MVYNNNRREKDFGSKRATCQPAPDVCAGTIEYKMSRTMAEEAIKAYNGAKKDPQEILCRYVNENFGLKSYCVKVLVDLQ